MRSIETRADDPARSQRNRRRVFAYRFVRCCAVAIAAFLVLTSVADLFGAIPYPEEQPPFANRVRESLYLLVVAFVLLLPYRKMNGREAREIGIVGIGVTLFWGLRIAIPGVIDSFRGFKSWHVVPVSVLLLAFLVANAYVFWQVTKRVVT